ncbi:MerR family transcriptional regulator [Streptomyces sp. NPDC093707]|uniref:MerR family transcriptional regulator n=1 Tax=Streptomyces sp. NPDC093707 TaxID=3154984 RepID=UPI0034508334
MLNHSLCELRLLSSDLTDRHGAYHHRHWKGSAVRIGELAHVAGVSTRALRYYEQRGLLQARRQDNGYREYEDSAVTRVHNIRVLLDAGLKAEDIRRLNSCLDEKHLDHNPACQEACALYEERLRAVQAQLAALAEVESKLQAKLAELRGDPYHARRPT